MNLCAIVIVGLGRVVDFVGGSLFDGGLVGKGCRCRIYISCLLGRFVGFLFMEQNYNRSLMNNTGIAWLSMSSGQGQRREIIKSVSLAGGWAGRTGAFVMIRLVEMSKQGD